VATGTRAGSCLWAVDVLERFWRDLRHFSLGLSPMGQSRHDIANFRAGSASRAEREPTTA
jgi:hypothetical protein